MESTKQRSKYEHLRIADSRAAVLEAEVNACGPEGLGRLLDAYDAHASLLQELALAAPD
ncbi:hypothetical protein KTF37_29025 [Burkholderia multivorans]|uniref:hypothetical protein n=1 Tax=Burkholderia multivorans TaxID=87883 RepID=UPI001C22850E|nr:hypothetical protein [Burkholderia multivorans]MBU9680895.1 hypothetical protein [Burkholderia multivorans]